MAFYDYTSAKIVDDLRINRRWEGRKIVFFGDSRVWYDGNAYVEGSKSEWVGKTCKGFQRQVEQLLGATVVSEATGGLHSYQICDNIKLFDFTGYDAAFFCGGVNDWYNPQTRDTIGEIAPIGSTFDLTTRYGNWQSAVEYVLGTYPQVKLFLSVPFRAWTGSGSSAREMPYSEAKIKQDVAELYDLPCIDLYSLTGLNTVNRDYYYADASSHVHLNDYGNALIGEIIAGFIATH